MGYAMMVCKSGIMYSGELLSEYKEDLKWIGIKPSKKSDVCIYFSADRIKKIYFQNGTSFVKQESDLREVPKLDLEIPENKIVLIRVLGGVSYRGESLSELPEEIKWREGYWISTSSTRESLIYIPEHEIEKVYSM